MFDANVREDLLFENSSYSNSRTYFWAIQSLRIINECLESIRTAYHGSGTTDWISESILDRPLEPYPTVYVGRSDYQQHISSLLDDVETQMGAIEQDIQDNEKRQVEIIALRDGVSQTSSQRVIILTFLSTAFQRLISSRSTHFGHSRREHQGLDLHIHCVHPRQFRNIDIWHAIGTTDVHEDLDLLHFHCLSLHGDLFARLGAGVEHEEGPCDGEACEEGSIRDRIAVSEYEEKF